MTLKLYKIVPYLIFLSSIPPLIITLFLDPVRQFVLSRYDIRYFVKMDGQNNSQLVVVSNRGSNKLPPVQVQVEIVSKTEKTVSDFRVVPQPEDTRGSYLESLAEALSQEGILARLTRHELKSIKQVLSESNKPQKLYELDLAFARIIKAIPKDHKNHRERERIRNVFIALRRKATDKWREAWKKIMNEDDTGVDINFSDRNLSPLEKIEFFFPVTSDQARHLQIFYGPDPILTKTRVGFRTETKQCIEIHEGDIKAPFWVMLFKHDLLVLVLILFSLIVIGIVYVKVGQRVKNPLIHEQFNMALVTNYKEHWERAYERKEADVTVGFRELCKAKNVNSRELDSKELKDLIQYRFFQRYKRTPYQFKNQEELDREIKEHLESIVNELPSNLPTP